MMWRAARMVGQYGLVLAVLIVLNFVIPRAAPGDVVDYLFPPNQGGELTPEQRREILSQYGLEKPTTEQFRVYVVGLAHGDLGYSVRYSRPVIDLVKEKIGWTVLLVGGSIVLSTVLGALLGFRSAWRRGTSRDAGVLSAVMAVDSMPAFFVGMLLILVFSVRLHWFPIFGALPMEDMTGLALAGDALKRLVLPLSTLTLVHVGGVYLVSRSALVSELQEDYVLMAQAKGLPDREVRRHAQRNALLPVSTVTLVSVAGLVGGATVVETVFSYPGLGSFIYQSVLAADYPALQGAFFLLAVCVLVVNFINELVYPLLDPRVRRPRPVTS